MELNIAVRYVIGLLVLLSAILFVAITAELYLWTNFSLGIGILAHIVAVVIAFLIVRMINRG